MLGPGIFCESGISRGSTAGWSVFNSPVRGKWSGVHWACGEVRGESITVSKPSLTPFLSGLP